MNMSVRMAVLMSLDATWPANKGRTDAQLFALAQQIISEGC